MLYNSIVEIYTEKSTQPRGHGWYIPSLDLAEQLLNKNPLASCALVLNFVRSFQLS